MRILMIIPSVSKKWGGTTTSLHNFYLGLTEKENVTCKVISTYTIEEKDEIDKDILENKDFELFKTSQNSWRYSKSFKHYLHNIDNMYDLIWIHALWTATSYLGAKYANKYNIPYVVTPHGMIEPDAMDRKSLKKKLYWNLIEKNIFSKASAIHCITNAEQSYSNNLTTTRSFIVANGVKQIEFIEKNYNSLEYICFMGRFHEKKALDLLLIAISKLDTIKLFIAGAGDKEYETYIFNLVKSLGLEERVEFKGFVNEKQKKEILTKSLFLVLPSHTEGLSMVGLESIMHSTPVLTTEKCNFNEIDTYHAGIVMSDNFPDMICENISTLLSSNIKVMSKKSYELASSKFSIDSVTNKIYKEFTNIINKAT